MRIDVKIVYDGMYVCHELVIGFWMLDEGEILIRLLQ